MSAAEKVHPEEHPKTAPVAANNPDFGQYFDNAGLLPLLGRTLQLVKGVGYDAPKATFGGAEPAHKKEHDKAHDKEHDKKEEAKEGEAKGEEKGEKKEEAKGEHGGHGANTQEWFGDVSALATSVYDVVKEGMEGKADAHTLEHAVSHGLDAMNLGFARPFAGLAGLLLSKGLIKAFGLRAHGLEKVDVQYDTLGAQILGLKKEKKSYHHAVEGLCHGINATELEEKFDCFTSRESFEAAIKTDPGREEIKAQLARIIGPTKNPNQTNAKERIERIEKILGTHVKEGDGKPEVKYHNDKEPENEKEKASLDALTFILHYMKLAVTAENIKQIYHGEKAEKMTIDYDKFGDYVFEHVRPDNNIDQTAFFKAFNIRVFENTFRLLLDKDRFAKALKKDESRKATREQLYGLFDLANGGDAKDVDRQAAALKKTLGLDGTPVPAETTPKGALLKNIIEIAEFLKADDNLEKLFAEEEKITIDYENFGDIVIEKVSGKVSAEAFYEGFKADIFQTKFEVLINPIELGRALKQPEGKEEMKTKLRQLFNMSGSIGLEALVARREKLLSLLGKADSASSKTKHAEFERLTETILKNLGWDFEQKPNPGPKPKNIWDKLYEEKPQVVQPRYAEFGRHLREIMAASNVQDGMVAFVRGYNSNLFRNEFPYLVDKSMMANAVQNELENDQARRQLIAFLGLNATTTTFPQIQGTLSMFKAVLGAESNYPDDLKGSGKNYKKIETDLAAIEAVLNDKETIEQLFGGVKIKPDYQKLGEQVAKLDEKKLQSLLNEIHVTGLFTNYGNLHALKAGTPTTDTVFKEGRKELLKLIGYPEGYPLDERKLEEELQRLTERIKNARIVAKNTNLGKDLLDFLNEFKEKVRGDRLTKLLESK